MIFLQKFRKNLSLFFFLNQGIIKQIGYATQAFPGMS